MDIIRKRKTIHFERYSLDFGWNDAPLSGFSFPCDKQGKVLLAEMPAPIARENLEACLNGTFDVIPQGVLDCSYNYTEHALGRCSCGETVDLIGFTNECDHCGRLYNFDGQALAPRNQWREG